MGEPSQLRRLGRYEIVDKLAHGGMAELFIARLPGVEGFAKRVVLKRVLPALVADRDFVDMFIAEARIAATLDHQNIVQVHDIGHDTDGYFFAMELLHGADVAELLRTTQHHTGIPLAIALEIARGACAGLHYAHERTGQSGASLGLVHRDVSPQNIFVTLDGAVKLLDWGIAKAVQQISNHYTRSGTLRGKIPYMSPEQCRGEPLDRRSDVFSLAVVIWEMTVGERLFGADAQGDFDVLKQIIETDAPRPSARRADYPPELERIVMKGLARDIRARYQTADELLVALEAFIRAGSSWSTTRDVSQFMAKTFPDRAAKRSAERATRESGGVIVPFPKRTVELPIEDEVSKPTAATPAPAAASARMGPKLEPKLEPKMEPKMGARVWPIAGAGLAVAGAIALGFALGRTTAPAPAHAPPHTPSPSSSPSPSQPAGPIEEDLHWFQADDFLISKKPYTGEKLPYLKVAKMLRAPKQPNDVAHFVDGTGKELETHGYWATRIATAADFVIGGLAFCMADGHERSAAKPSTKAHARRNNWMVARITDVADVPEGKVTVGDVVCAVDGVRVPR